MTVKVISEQEVLARPPPRRNPAFCRPITASMPAGGRSCPFLRSGTQKNERHAPSAAIESAGARQRREGA